jgi:hypothetical protein
VLIDRGLLKLGEILIERELGFGKSRKSSRFPTLVVLLSRLELRLTLAQCDLVLFLRSREMSTQAVNRWRQEFRRIWRRASVDCRSGLELGQLCSRLQTRELERFVRAQSVGKKPVQLVEIRLQCLVL